MCKYKKYIRQWLKYIVPIIPAFLGVGLICKCTLWQEQVLFAVFMLMVYCIPQKSERVVMLVALAVSIAVMAGYSFCNVPHWLKNQYLGTSTVWQLNDERNEFFLHTILKDKECIVSPNGWYKDYANVISKGIIEESSLEETIDTNEIQNEFTFIEVGTQRAFVNYTLVSDVIKALGEDRVNMQLYVDLDDLEKAERVVLLNDSGGNIYIVSESEWKK